jgi:hypothetical protein
MKFDYYFLEDDKEYNYQIEWGLDDENDKEIEKWCNTTFGSAWENCIKDYSLIYLKNEKDLALFLLRWG